MKKTPIFFLKTVLAIIGFVLIAFGFFNEFQSTCGFVKGFGDIVPISISGSNSGLWHYFLIGSVLVFALGYFFNYPVNKILVYFFTGIFTLLIAFLVWISKAGFGGPCGYSVEEGYYLTLFGSLSVLSATIISMHRKKKIATKPAIELLDQE
jgi:hypothetical protein